MTRRRIRLILLSALTGFLLLPMLWVSSASATRSCAPASDFDPNDFSNPTLIDNEWLPLVPGRQFVLDGHANRGGGLLPHRVVTTVTDLTKVIDGVPTVVVFDQDFNEGDLVESELAFFAQDDEGNVWSLGEYPEEYEGGVFLGAPSTWIPGVAEAQAGTMMRADPRLGTHWYSQGSAPTIDFLDCGKVHKVGERICVASCYGNVLVTKETSPLEPGGVQLKYYAPEVGNVAVGAVGDPEGETLVLTGLRTLGSAELAQVHGQALGQDARGYTVSPDVYGLTSPAA